MEEEHANADGKMHSQCTFEVYETLLPQAFVWGPFEKVTTFLSTSHSLGNPSTEFHPCLKTHKAAVYI